ncbi:zinc-ribbon domain-containing protein [Streptomyces sp. NBC_01591]|uniref:zinc-ribbon domain-containing protein n=1 Tax=Streptomyces sp. NBC_01591 TaxID=2975888 RepID=UPI002DDAB587|nr:zinc-ribbon domain-containing protein [Streptomyces sp. NBC_01591]WSD70102.1 zinc-ribbon domain-containing protein [Streptomyces sp. NBC_01591]
MPLYCPFCGTQAPDGALFCMKCGRERPTAETEPEAGTARLAPPPVPPLAPPPMPPAASPLSGPAVPSPLGAFFGRTFRGDWAGSVKAAAWPSGLILALAVALAIPSYGQGDDIVVGWSDRLRIALAMLLQAFGGGFELRPTGPGGGENSGGFGDSGFGDGGYDFDGGMSQGGASLSMVPLTVTVLWVGALILGARRARAQGGGLEAAVRIGLVASAAVLVLGLFAQPDVAGVSVSSAPLLATLGALVISLLVTGGVLQRDVSAQWLAARPVALTTVRAAGTAVRALGVVLLLCSLIGFIVYANADDVDGEAMLIALPLLPNIGLAVLGLSWGAPVEYDVRGQVSFFGSGMEHGGFGLSELGEAVNGWAVTGALAIGVVCALAVGISAARRSADRREQVTAGAMFLAMFLVLSGVGGVSVALSGGGFGDVGGQGTGELAPSVSDALLFGLLWVGGAVLVAPYLLRLLGRATPMSGPGTAPTPPGAAPGAPYGPGAPYDPATPAAYAPSVPSTPAVPPTPTPTPTPTPAPTPSPSPYDAAPYDPQTVGLTVEPVARPASPAGDRRRTALIWTGTLVAALLVGGGATAGVLALMDSRSGDGAPKDDKPAAEARSSQEPSAEPSQQQTPSTSPTATASTTPSAPTVPEGFRLVSDTAGFSFAVPTVWDRRSEENNQITYAGSTGRAALKVGVIRNAPYSSYENFVTLERTADANQKNYRRLELTANSFQGRPGAIWEYTYEDRESGETIHAIDQSYIADDGTEYAIYTTERDTEWPGARRIFDTALSTWMLNDTD